MLYEVKCELIDILLHEIVEANSQDDAIEIFHTFSPDYLELIEENSPALREEYLTVYKTYILKRVYDENIDGEYTYNELIDIVDDLEDLKEYLYGLDETYKYPKRHVNAYLNR